MLLKSPFKALNEDLILLNIEKQIGAATFSVEHLCL